MQLRGFSHGVVPNYMDEDGNIDNEMTYLDLPGNQSKHIKR
jgi:hypothetical protein